MLILIAGKLFSQPLVIDWQQCYVRGDLAGGYNIIKTANGYVIFGGTYSYSEQFMYSLGDGDFLLIWTDSVGNSISENIYGGSEFDYPSDMERTLDGGFILFGETFSNNGDVNGNHGSGDLWVVKVDSTGNILWQNCFGGSAIELRGLNIEMDVDSGFLCVGSTASSDGDVTGYHGSYDVWLVRFNKYGNLVWENSYGGSDLDVGTFAIHTPDGGIILAGATGSVDGDVQCEYHGGTGDAWLMKLDSSGNIEWQNCYGGSDWDNITQIICTSDGGYLCSGNTSSNDGQVFGNHGDTDLWVIKLDSLGNLLWQKCFGGSDQEFPNIFKPTSDGNYLIGGQSHSSDGDVSGNHSAPDYQDGWILKIDPSGNLIWQQCFGGDENEVVSDVLELENGKYIILGSTSTSDNTGDVICDSHVGLGAVWLIQATDTTYAGIYSMNNSNIKISLYPNPAVNTITFDYQLPPFAKRTSLKIINGLGKIISTFLLPDNQGKLMIDIQSYPPGIYGYTLVNDSFSRSGKFIRSE